MELLDRLGLDPGTFDGRVAVVTGGARGIGEQVARGLAHLGAHAIVLDILESGEEIAGQIRGNSRSAEFKQVDLADLDALDRVHREILEEHGQVDVLVNNASKLEFQSFVETPMSRWDELHNITVRASAYLISKFLPVMTEREYGIVCNTVAGEGFPYAAYFSAAMVGQRSMIFSLAGETDKFANLSVFGFAPGVVDTPLVAGLAPSYPELFGMSQAEYHANILDNPGYDSLMPVEDCGASYVYCLAHATEYHGQIADAFHPLINHGIITPKNDGEKKSASDAVNDYVKGISSVNRNLENRIEERTRELEAANQLLANQNQLIEDLSSKLSRYLPQQVYQSIFSGEIDAEIQSRRKHLTVFFSDIREFTRKTERLEPEALSEILNTYFSNMTELARAHGATIDKFIGDAILAFFGDPESLGAEGDAERCLKMAIDMQRRMAELQHEFVRLGLNEPLEIRIGINSGYCTVGNFGSYDRLDYTIIGSPVNIAARLQEHSKPNMIVVSKSTQALVADKFNFKHLGKLDLKGIVDEVEAFEVLVADDAQPSGANSAGDQFTALKEQLAEIDIEQLGEKEKNELLNAMSKLLKR